MAAAWLLFIIKPCCCSICLALSGVTFRDPFSGTTAACCDIVFNGFNQVNSWCSFISFIVVMKGKSAGGTFLIMSIKKPDPEKVILFSPSTCN